MKTPLLALASALVLTLSVNAQDRDAYFNPQPLTGDINWNDIAWVDDLGGAVAAPDADTNVHLSGPRAGSYRHVFVSAGSDITIKSLELANQNWQGNGWRTLDIIGTEGNLVNFTVLNEIKVTQNFNSLYAAYTNFTSGDITLPYYGRLSLENSTINIGNIKTGNVGSLLFNATTGTAGSLDVGNSADLSITNSSAITFGGFYTGAVHVLTVTDSSATFNGNYVITSTATLNLTNAAVDIDTGVRISSGALNLNMTDSSLIIRRATYSGATNSSLTVSDGQVATIVLSNSTINGGAKNIDIRNAASTITISNLDDSKTAIICDNLNFTGVLTIDFTGMIVPLDTEFLLISANNARTMFEDLLASDNVVVTGLKPGESFSWNITDTSVALAFTAIPEPSVYAGVLGMLALAFAAYRRRS